MNVTNEFKNANNMILKHKIAIYGNRLVALDYDENVIYSEREIERKILLDNADKELMDIAYLIELIRKLAPRTDGEYKMNDICNSILFIHPGSIGQSITNYQNEISNKNYENL